MSAGAERPEWIAKPASGVAAGGPRPPFQSGNLAHMTGGHRTARVYGALAEELVAGLVEDRPDLARYPESLASWATAEAQCALLRRHLAEVGTLDETGQPRSGLLAWLDRFEGSARKHRATLGLDPISEARLSRERATAAVLAVDLDALAERGQAALAAREAAGLPRPPDLAGTVLEVARADYKAERQEAAERLATDHDNDHDDREE